jgi:short-subunit dehydrogenase
MKKAIIIGASSGIGKALAKELSQNNYTVGLTGRRIELLQDLQKKLPHPSFVKKMDVTQIEESIQNLQELIEEMGGMDLIIINAGTGFFSLDLNWEEEYQTLMTNIMGFAAIANMAFRYFKNQRHGHIVGISSIAALRGSGDSPAYNASKAFESNYLEGLRIKAGKLKRPIYVTDIQPGFVDTAMVKSDIVFWKATPEKAAHQIYRAITRKKRHAYITKRWRLIAWIMKTLPHWIHRKV